MQRPSRRLAWVAAGVALSIGIGAFGLDRVADRVAADYNPVRDPGPYQVGERAAALHRELFVVDLHADPLLWGRDLLERGSHGQVDLPRLIEGGVALQVFGAVTKSPKGQNYRRNRDAWDRITPLVMAQGWPLRTWGSLLERALYQAERLDRVVAGSGGRLVEIETRDDLVALRDRRARGEAVVGALLGLEGAHALEGRLEHLDRLHRAGYRMLGLAHFFDNEVAGSAHGLEQGGLTDLGRDVVRRARELGMIVDVSHASTAALTAAVDLACGPVVASHTGVRGTCDGPRNLRDRDLRAIAETGGVAGIGLFEGAVCGTDLAATVTAIRYAIGVVGIEHVALGSDFDGAVATPIDVSGLPLLTEALVAAGLSRGEVAAVMGENAYRALAESLPPAASAP